MSKIKRFFNENKFILTAGGISLFIILLVYFCYGIIPFGDKTVYRMDLYHQYGPLFSELYDRLTSGGSLIYSWNTGLGGSFLGNFYNYLSSPVSAIILLFGRENTFEAVAAMIAVKAVLISMSMSYYLKKSKNEDSLVTAAFGILYTFCGFFIAYYWNIMWIDAMYILPFVVLGIERIIDKGKSGLYLASLVLAVFSNYYIGFMICIFSCLYFIYYYVCSYDKIKLRKRRLEANTFKSKLKNSFFLQSGLKFTLASLSVGVILLFMLIPLVSVLRASSATGDTAPEEQSFYFDVLDFLANHLAGLEPTIRSSGTDVLPNIYCGILPLLLIPLYLFSTRISSREKIASAVFLCIMFFSFNLNLLNFVWHGFHFPNDLPYRQSFMYSFLLLTMAFKAFKGIGEFNKKQILATGLSLSAVIIAVQAIGSKNVEDASVYISLAFVFMFTVILGLFVSKRTIAAALSVMLVCTVTAEMIIANTDHYVANQTKEAFAGDYDDFKALQRKIGEGDDSAFYREELSSLRARMDASWYGYNGVSVFSSMAYEKVANMQKYIGLHGNLINSCTYNPQTPIYNSMFSLNYIYDRHNLISEGDYYTEKLSAGVFTAYENKYPLSIGFPVADTLTQWDAATCENPVVAQNELFKLSTGISDVIEQKFDYELMYNNVLSLGQESIDMGILPLSKVDNELPASATVTIIPEEDENIYIYVNSRNLDTVSAYSFKLSATMDVEDGYILDLGRHSKGDVITVELPIKESETYATVDFSVFTVNKEKFEKGYEQLKNGQLEYTDFSDTAVEGTFTAEKNEILYTSIPYDASWQITLDGEAVSEDDIIKISDALLGIRVTEGEHTVKLVYSPSGMNSAIIISAVFAVLLIIIFIMKNKRILFFKDRRANIWERSDRAEFVEPHSCNTETADSEIIIKFNDTEIDENDGDVQ